MGVKVGLVGCDGASMDQLMTYVVNGDVPLDDPVSPCCVFSSNL